MGDKPRILIVGAGIAGLTLAAGLERRGLAPTIVEIADGLLTRGLGLFLTSNVFLALRRLRLDKTIIERGVVIKEQIQTDASETPNNYHDFRPFNARYAPNIAIARGSDERSAHRSCVADSLLDHDRQYGSVG